MRSSGTLEDLVCVDDKTKGALTIRLTLTETSGYIFLEKVQCSYFMFSKYISNISGQRHFGNINCFRYIILMSGKHKLEYSLWRGLRSVLYYKISNKTSRKQPLQMHFESICFCFHTHTI